MIGAVSFGLMPLADAFKGFPIIDNAPIAGLSSSGDEVNHPLGRPTAASGANPHARPKAVPIGEICDSHVLTTNHWNMRSLIHHQGGWDF